MSDLMVETPNRPASTLPEEPTQASRFGKARSAQSGALLEDYVELISDLLTNGGEARPTDIARRLGVAHATAIKTIGRLKREGLAVAKPYRGVFLTEAGESLAARVRARHRVVVDLAAGGWGAVRSGRVGRRGDRAPRVGHDAGRVRPVSGEAVSRFPTGPEDGWASGRGYSGIASKVSMRWLSQTTMRSA